MFADLLIQSLITLLLLSLLLQLYYVVFVHYKLARHTDKKSSPKTKHPVSVIIYARNQAQSLVANLPDFLDQDYPHFEIIVVNDCSWDDTEELLRDFASRYYRLKVVTVPNHDRFRKNKKFAITMGIKAAKNEILIFSEANCRPNSKKWIKEIHAGFTGNTELVLGHSFYQKSPGFFNSFIRYEGFINALNYLSTALNGNAYRGTGRNMAYLKSVFFSGKGFASHMHLPFGDDDLFINQHANNQNTAISIKAPSQVYTVTKISFKQYFIDQSSRMLAAFYYTPANLLKIGLQTVSGVLFYTTLIGLAVLNFDWRLLLGIYVLRLCVQLGIYFKIFKKLNYSDLKWWLPVLDFIYYIYVLALSITTLFKFKTRWK